MPSKYGFRTQRDGERALREQKKRNERLAAKARRLKFVKDVLEDWARASFGPPKPSSLVERFLATGPGKWVLSEPEAPWQVYWKVDDAYAAPGDYIEPYVIVDPVFDERERVVGLNVRIGHASVEAVCSVQGLVAALKELTEPS